MEKEFKLATGTVCRTQLEHKIYDLIAKTLFSMDYTIVRIRVFKSGDKHVVQMMLEKNDETSININDCEKASRCASNILDANDPMSEDSYNLEVSSTGINRPLTRPEDFTTFIGSKIRLKTLTKIDGQGVFTGIIQKSDGKNIVISDSFSESTTVIEISNIVDAKLEIETREKTSDEKRRFDGNFDNKRVSGRKFGSKKPRFSSGDGERKSFGDRGPRRDGEERRSFGDRKPARFASSGGERRSFGDRGPRRDGEERRSFGDRKPARFASSGGERKSFGDRGPRRDGDERRSFGDRKPRRDGEERKNSKFIKSRSRTK